MMSDLSREAREALQAFRAEERPTASQRQRIWSDIETDAANERWQRAVPRSGGTLRQWLTVAVAAAAVALLALSWLQGRVASENETDPTAMGAPYGADTSAEPEMVHPSSLRSTAVAQPEDVESPGPATDLVEPEVEPEPPETRREEASEQSPADPLETERQLIEAAHAALGRADAKLALDLVERHAREFPKGQMAEEASVYRARALCELGRLEEARAEVRRFLDAWPDSQHHARMLRTCVQRPTGR
jgi:hypothetical protein